MPLSRKYDSHVPPKALVIGAMNMDVQAVAGQVPIARDSTPGSVTSCAGGVGRNIAEGLARLGIHTTLVTVVADDDAGRQLLSHCEAAGIKSTVVVSIDGYNTPSYVSILADDGGLLYAVNDMQMMERLKIEEIPQLAQLIGDSDMCVIDSNLPDRFIQQLAPKVRKIPFVADTVSVAKCHRIKAVLPSLSLLKVNLHEAQALVSSVAVTTAATSGSAESAKNNNDTPVTRAHVDQLLEKLLKLGPDAILLTLGRDGTLLATLVNGIVVTCSSAAPDVKVVSVNGAGDALMAGVLAAWLYGKDTDEQLRWGTMCAGLSLVTHKACAEQLSIQCMPI